MRRYLNSSKKQKKIRHQIRKTDNFCSGHFLIQQLFLSDLLATPKKQFFPKYALQKSNGGISLHFLKQAFHDYGR